MTRPNPTATSPANRPIGARHLTRVLDLAQHEVNGLLSFAATLKTDYAPWADCFRQQALALAFEKPSLRTRASFEVGFQKLGGSVVFLDQQPSPIGERESIADYARNMERWVSVLVARTRRQSTISELARWSSIPVVNALSDEHHPCQALADWFTIKERLGSMTTVHLAWVGDGNNVCHSLMEAAASVGGQMTVITPAGLEPSAEILRSCQARSMRTGASIRVTNDLSAVAGAHAVYTDAWISMGQDDAEHKSARLRPYQVNAALMARAAPGALFMHCLPAHRGEEVTDEVIDSSASVVFDQAENRMHTQNAVLLALLRPDIVTFSPGGEPVVSRD
jgi:ornithine carbamoyltransferase